MKIEPRGLADGWDRNYVIKQEKSRSVAGFVTQQVETKMPLMEMGNTEREAYFRGEIKNLILDMTNLECLLDTQEELLSGQLVL